MRNSRGLTKINRPPWAVEVDKVIAERGITKKSIAGVIGVNYSYLVNVLCGNTPDATGNIQRKLYQFLGINGHANVFAEIEKDPVTGGGATGFVATD